MDCVINPLTGRAVKINSLAGRKVLKYNSKNNLKASHDCLTNPKTGRAVKKDSAIGRRIMKQDKSQPTPSAKQATPPAKQATPPAKQAPPPAKQAPPPAKQAPPPAKQAPPIVKTKEVEDEATKIKKSIIFKKKLRELQVKEYLKVMNSYLERYYNENGITSKDEKEKINKSIFKDLDFDVFLRATFNKEGDEVFTLEDRNIMSETISYVMLIKSELNNTKKKINNLTFYKPKALKTTNVEYFPAKSKIEEPPKPKLKIEEPPKPKPKIEESQTPPAPKPKNNNSSETLKVIGTFIKDTEEYLKSKSKRAFNDLIKKYNNKEYISEVIGAQIFGDFYPTPQKCLDHAYGDMPEYFADDEVFLEPTAGLGSIVYWLLNKKVKGKIITTDFDANLHIYLKNNFEKFNNVDVIPHEKSDYLKLENNFVGYKPTVIFLNPPFSKGNDKRYYLNFLYKALYDLKNSKSRYNERQLFFISPQLTKDEKDGRQINLRDDIEMSPNKKKEIMKMLNIDEEEFDDLTPLQTMRIKTCKEFAGTNIEAVFYHVIIYV